MEQEAFKKHLGRMQALCSRGEKCRADIRMKLEKEEIASETVERILSALEKDRFLDEERYAKAFVNDKSRLQGWGPVKISNMLKIKKIPDEIISMALQEIGDTQIRNTLKNCLIKKAASIKESDPVRRRAKLIRFALGRGYTYAQIYQVLKQL
jgi:regulatory protein